DVGNGVVGDEGGRRVQLRRGLGRVGPLLSEMCNGQRHVSSNKKDLRLRRPLISRRLGSRAVRCPHRGRQTRSRRSSAGTLPPCYQRTIRSSSSHRSRAVGRESSSASATTPRCSQAACWSRPTCWSTAFTSTARGC